MKLLCFGSRNLTARHLPAMRSFLALDRLAVDGWWTVGEPIQLIHGDGPPGRPPGAIGADKLAEVAASLEWPETRRVKRYHVTPEGGETWAHAAARRNRAMVDAKPDRALCFHENLDMSKGSAMTADFLQRAGVRFRYVRLTSAGAVVSVEDR
jgi:hypothetical protein